MSTTDAPPGVNKPGPLARGLGVFRYTRHAIQLVRDTNPQLLVAIGAATLIAGLLPAGIAFVGKLIIDGVVLASQTQTDADIQTAIFWVIVEGGLVVAMAATQRVLSVCEQLLRAQLGHRVNVLILDKALQMDLVHFEDSEFYDQMNRARREASSRPLSLVNRSFGLIQNGISLVTYGILLIQLSVIAVLVLVIAAVPAFIAETKFAGEAFRLFSWRSPEKREQAYLEVVVAREDYAKEVKLLDLGPRLVDRYKRIFDKLYAEDRGLTLRRGLWGLGLGLLSTTALYGAYLWIASQAIAGLITIGAMTMYLMVFKQGQSAFTAMLQSIGRMYEDNLYLSNLYAFLERPVLRGPGGAAAGPDPADGIRFEEVTFTYPDANRPAVDGLTLHVPPGQKLALVGHNGSGKTTLVKLLTRLYTPDSGRILLDGLPLEAWDEQALRGRVGVIFQDFVKYQFPVGENIGVGDVAHADDASRWERAATKGMARPFIEALPDGYDTQLGRWFKGGQELSLGQWQKIALSRAFMRQDAHILVLDEPTAAMDALAEAEIFERFREMTDNQMAILISHRFSTVRMADQIAVLDAGRLVELGSHETLMADDGLYAKLFSVQAKGYR